MQSTDTLELFKELSQKFTVSGGRAVQHNNEQWSSEDYIRLLGRLKAELDSKNEVNTEIDWLYNKYESTILSYN